MSECSRSTRVRRPLNAASSLVVALRWFQREHVLAYAPQVRKTPRQQRSQDMVQRMVDAGRRVLLSDGYANFSTNRVADVAGVSPGSLYRYFSDKDDLLAVILDRYWDEAAQRVEASLADRLGDPPDQMVRNVVEALLSALEQDSQLLQVVEAISLEGLQDRHQALRRRVQDLAFAYLNLMLRSSGSKAKTRAWVIVVAMEGLATRWVLDRPRIPRDELVDELTVLVENYIGAALPGSAETSN